MSTTSLPGTKRAAGLLFSVLIAAANAAVAADSAGQRIYRDGMLPSGRPLQGTLRNGVALSGAVAACSVCHRRSGLGGGEGQRAVRPIAGRLLFAQPRHGNTSRPAYTLATLGRALRDGVDPSGRALDELMPRFELDDDDVMQLADYLQELAPGTAPGVSGSEIHFATIVAPGVATAQEQAMLDTLQAFFADKNGGTRQEQRRRDIGRNVTGSEQMYRAYRNWQLHTWRLKGPPQSWRAQLENHYREQPVFAVLSGAGADEWRPVHEFCEGNEIPCLFPSIGFSGLAQDGYASFYFSRGAELEAEVLAKHLAASDERSGIVQVFRDDGNGRVPADALRAALQRRGIDTVIDRPLVGSRPVPDSFWMKLLDADRPRTLILWLNDADIAGFPFQQEAPPLLNGLYVSGSLVARDGLPQAQGWRDKVRIVDQMDLAERRAQHVTRMKVWLRARNVPLADERIQANAFFAASVAGDALAHMDEIFSRDYFIERVEHMTEQSLFHSVYPRLSLGPGQRFASKGGYVTRFAQDSGDKDSGGKAASSEWIVP
jgi:cytochrome c553